MRLSTAAIILMFSGSMAFAQAFDTKPMNEGLTMLQDSAMNAFQRYGIETDVMSLTLLQLGEISGILANSSEDTEMKRELKAAIARK